MDLSSADRFGDLKQFGDKSGDVPGEESSEYDSEEEREQVKSEILDIFKKRDEPLTVSQLSYALKYNKAYIEDCLAMLPQIKARELSKTLKVYFLPQKALPQPVLEVDFNSLLNTKF